MDNKGTIVAPVNAHTGGGGTKSVGDIQAPIEPVTKMVSKLLVFSNNRAATQAMSFNMSAEEEEEGQKGRRSGPSGVVHLIEVEVVQHG